MGLHDRHYIYYKAIWPIFHNIHVYKDQTQRVENMFTQISRSNNSGSEKEWESLFIFPFFFRSKTTHKNRDIVVRKFIYVYVCVRTWIKKYINCCSCHFKKFKYQKIYSHCFRIKWISWMRFRKTYRKSHQSLSQYQTFKII